MESHALPPLNGDSAPAGMRPAWQRAAALLAAALVALWFLWRVRDVLPPFLIAFFLAALLDPVVTRLQRRGYPRARAVALIYLLVFLNLLLAGFLVVPAAMRQVGELGQNIQWYQRNLLRQTDGLYERFKRPLAALGVKKNPIHDRSGPVAQAASGLLEGLKRSVAGLAGQVLWLIIIPLSLFYFLMDFQALRAKLISLAPPSYREHLDRMSAEIVEIFSQYARSLAIVCVFYALGACILFYWLGLRYALFLGILAGVLYAVPYIGPAVAIGSAGIIALMMNPVMLWPTGIVLSPGAYAALVVALFVAMHLAFDYVVTPRVVGGSVGLHPVVNIFALMCGATLFGVWGMLLAVPVAASIQMLLIYFFPRLAEKPTGASPSLVDAGEGERAIVAEHPAAQIQ